MRSPSFIYALFFFTQILSHNYYRIIKKLYLKILIYLYHRILA